MTPEEAIRSGMGTTGRPPSDKDVADIDLEACEAEFLVLLTGFDETFAQTVHARSSYRTDELVHGARFGSMFDHDEAAGQLGVDLARIHDVLPAPLGGSAARPTVGNAGS